MAEDEPTGFNKGEGRLREEEEDGWLWAWAGSAPDDDGGAIETRKVRCCFACKSTLLSLR